MVLLFLCSLFVLSSAYPNGAPELGCYTSRPMHDTHMPQWTNITYVLEFNPPKTKLTYAKGSPITLTLRSLYPTEYKLSGYLVTMTSSSGLTGGKWRTLTPDSKAIPECGVTQTSRSDKRNTVDFEYTPPTDIDLETIQFKAIAVHNFSVFWDNILSPPLVQKADSSVSEIEKMIQQFASMAKLFNFSVGSGSGTPESSTSPSASPPSSSRSRSSRSKKF